MFCIEWRIEILFGDIFVVVLEPFECISGVIIIDHASDFGGIVVEVAESPAHVVGLDVVEVDVVADGCGEEGEELANIL